MGGSSVAPPAPRVPRYARDDTLVLTELALHLLHFPRRESGTDQQQQDAREEFDDAARCLGRDSEEPRAEDDAGDAQNTGANGDAFGRIADREIVISL